MHRSLIIQISELSDSSSECHCTGRSENWPDGMRFRVGCSNIWTKDTIYVMHELLGDLPEAYHIVTVPEDGTRRIYWDSNGDAVPNLAGAVWLGNIVDTEGEAIHCPFAQADDTRAAMEGYDHPEDDDEDGVTFYAYVWTEGWADVNYLDVTVSGVAPISEAYFAGWVDWNGDGDFDDAGDWIVGEMLPVGMTRVHFQGARLARTPTGVMLRN